MFKKFKIKLKASLIHLLLSILIISLSMGAIIYYWFPLEYLGITNFKDITLLILSIDLVLGPLLTFFVFNPTKKNLRLDLAIIAAIQLTALIYGVNALYQIHPLYITYNHGKFNLIHANEVNPNDAKYEEFKLSKLSSPKLAFAKMPDDPEKQTEIMMSVDLKGEPDIDKLTEYYEPYQNHMDTILKSSLNDTKLFKDKYLTPSSKAFLKEYGNKEHYAYLPIKGVAGDAIIVLDKNSSEVLTTIKANPWKFVKK